MLFAEVKGVISLGGTPSVPKKEVTEADAEELSVAEDVEPLLVACFSVEG